MKIACTQENFLEGLQLVSSIAEKNSNLPVLSNLLIQAEKNSITITATNLELGIAVHVRGKVEEEGQITIPARLLTDYIKSLPHGNVTIAVLENNNIKIQSGANQSTIAGISAEEFPPLPKVNVEKTLIVSGSELKKALSTVLFAASRDEARPEINGVYCAASDESVSFAATDGHRLAEFVITSPKKQEIDGIILPLTTCHELQRLVGDEEVTLGVGENQIEIKNENFQLISRLIEGTFIDYHALFPKDFTTTTRFNRQELLTTVRSTSLFARRNIQDITLQIKKSEIVLMAEATQVGASTASVACSTTGSAAKIVFNAQYLIDGLASYEEEELSLGVNTEKDPALLKTVAGDHHTYLIMPINL